MQRRPQRAEAPRLWARAWKRSQSLPAARPLTRIRFARECSRAPAALAIAAAATSGRGLAGAALLGEAQQETACRTPSGGVLNRSAGAEFCARCDRAWQASHLGDGPQAPRRASADA